MILPTSESLSRSASGSESSSSSSTIVFRYRATIAATVCDIASGGAVGEELVAAARGDGCKAGILRVCSSQTSTPARIKKGIATATAAITFRFTIASEKPRKGKRQTHSSPSFWMAVVQKNLYRACTAGLHASSTRSGGGSR